jgi:hypothetical protein
MKDSLKEDLRLFCFGVFVLRAFALRLYTLKFFCFGLFALGLLLGAFSLGFCLRLFAFGFLAFWCGRLLEGKRIAEGKVLEEDC